MGSDGWLVWICVEKRCMSSRSYSVNNAHLQETTLELDSILRQSSKYITSGHLTCDLP